MAIRPDFHLAWKNLGLVYLLSGRLEEFEGLLTRNPDPKQRIQISAELRSMQDEVSRSEGER